MAALDDLAAHISQLDDVTCAFQCEAPILVADNATATHLYHIAQEAVTNAIRHGRPRHIEMRLADKDGRMSLTVVDDGVGIQKPANKGKGMGLRIMAYRARMIGATLAVEPAQGGGTRVTCTLPQGPS